MPQFVIPSETFTRIANAAAKTGNQSCVRLEYINGKYYAVSSNSWVIAIEYLGETDQPDAAVNVAVNNGWQIMVNTFATETNFIFDWFPEFNILTSPNLPGTATAVSDADVRPPFLRWFDIIPTNSTKDKGFLYVEDEQIAALCAASPSGNLCFPSIVDSGRVMIVRDAIDPNWCGAFFASDKSKAAKPAVRPEWMP